MRRFSFNVDLRKPNAPGTSDTQKPAVNVRDGFQLSDTLRPQRLNMREWPRFQRALESLLEPKTASGKFADAALGQEYLRIHGVTRRKILDAAPGFDQEGKLETHCFFAHDGSKHLVSRPIAMASARITELTMFPTGEVTRLYYQNMGGPDQDLDDLYEHGLVGLETDVSRFARHPHYVLKFVLMPCKNEVLLEAYKGTCYFDVDNGNVATDEET